MILIGMILQVDSQLRNSSNSHEKIIFLTDFDQMELYIAKIIQIKKDNMVMTMQILTLADKRRLGNQVTITRQDELNISNANQY